MRAVLIDPDSARFSREKVIGREKVCGAVNARNRMGGYTGASGFLYMDGYARVADVGIMDSLGLEIVLAELCK